jgi:hypothetical protein
MNISSRYLSPPWRFVLLILGFELLALLMGALLSSCGGGGSSAGVSTTGTGQVVMMLTDGPTGAYDQINVTITAVDLLGDRASTRIFSGPARTVDLLQLRDQADLFSLANVPRGTYSRIRLTVSDVQLVDSTGATISPKLPGGNHIDLVPRAPFIITGGDSLVVQVDLDAEKSLHVVKAGRSGLTIFRPVVFVDIIDGAVSARIAEIHGTVSNIRVDAGTFDLCRLNARRDLSDRCLTVQTADASFFNGDGTAGAFSDLVDNRPVTVVGHLRRTTTGVALAARVIYLGDAASLTHVRGTTATAYDTGTGQFTVNVSKSDGFTSGQTIGAGLLDGAAVFGRSGVELTSADIAAGLKTRILGLKNAAGSPDLNALAVVVDDTAAAAADMISGDVGTVTGVDFTLVPSTTGNVTSDTNVCTTDKTRIYQINGAASSAITVGELTSGWAANVYGEKSPSGCFAATTVIEFQAN